MAERRKILTIHTAGMPVPAFVSILGGLSDWYPDATVETTTEGWIVWDVPFEPPVLVPHPGWGCSACGQSLNACGRDDRDDLNCCSECDRLGRAGGARVVTVQQYIVGEAIEVMGTLPEESVDTVVSSPPFLGLRDYESGDTREIGHETSPGEFIDALLAVVSACRRVLKPGGSLCFELGDTYADSGGAGGDYNEGGLRDGQPKWKQRKDQGDRRKVGGEDRPGGHHNGGLGWPPGKSMTLIPHLFAASLAYGRNLLTGTDVADEWRVRNMICWARRNPTPGAVGDKLRVGTSYITMACPARQRYWDRSVLDVVGDDGPVPALDWMIEPGEDTWLIANGTKGRSPIAAAERSHFAVWPEEVARRLIAATCPPGGLVLDPFCGTGTTLAAAQGIGRMGIGIDLDVRNAELAREKVGMFLEAYRLHVDETGSGLRPIL